MEWQGQVLKNLSAELSLSFEDKGQLFEQEKVDSKQLIEGKVKLNGADGGSDEQFAQLQKQFFQSL